MDAEMREHLRQLGDAAGSMASTFENSADHARRMEMEDVAEDLEEVSRLLTSVAERVERRVSRVMPS